VAQPWNSCPSDWGNAARLHLGSSGGHVVLDGRDFQVGGGALLDYMPRVVTSPLDQARAGRHPLSINASIGTISRDALGDPVFTCFRAAGETEVWGRRRIPTEFKRWPTDILLARHRPSPIARGA